MVLKLMRNLPRFHVVVMSGRSPILPRADNLAKRPSHAQITARRLSNPICCLSGRCSYTFLRCRCKVHGAASLVVQGATEPPFSARVNPTPQFPNSSGLNYLWSRGSGWPAT